MTAPIRRDTARVILLGPGGRVLLFRHRLPGPWSREGWLTPGGAIEPHETPAQAAVRELREETGHLVETGPPVAYDSGPWWSDDGTAYTTVNWYFHARIATDVVDLSGQDAYERRGLIAYRWWSPADLTATADLVFPVGIADLCARLTAGDLPARPLRLPWI